MDKSGVLRAQRGRRLLLGTPRKGIAPTGSGRKTMEWISVKDRLPEEREKVIILLLDGQIFRAEIRKRELLPEW